MSDQDHPNDPLHGAMNPLARMSMFLQVFGVNMLPEEAR